jgi:hypothetical protein
MTLKMENKGKVKYFNQHFTTILNKIPANVSLMEALQVEFYTLSYRHACQES